MTTPSTPPPGPHQAPVARYRTPPGPYPHYMPVYAVRPPTEPVSVICLVAAILAILSSWLPWVGLFLAIIAVVLGHLAIRQLNRATVPMSGKGLAVGGLITGYVALAISLAVTAVAWFLVDVARQSFG